MSDQQPTLSQAFLLASRAGVTTLPVEPTASTGGCGCGSGDAKTEATPKDQQTTKSSCCG